MVTGDLTMTVPILALPGNAGMDLRFSYTYNSQAYGPDTVTITDEHDHATLTTPPTAMWKN